MNLYDPLTKSRDRLTGLCAKLDGQRAEQKPENGGWSISEILEHLAVTERVAGLAVKRALGQEAADAAAIEGTKGLDAVIRERVAQRLTKVDAPEVAQPKGRFGPWPGALESFLEMRDQTLELAKGDPAALGERIFPHPFLGPMTLKQWLEFIAAHTERHAEQIEELLDTGGR